MKKIKNIALTVLALVGLNACDSFLDINVSPNSTVAPPARTILASITSEVGFRMGSDIHRFTSIWVQQFTGGGAAGTQTVEYALYNVTATDVNNVWRAGFYGGLLSDCQQLVNLTESSSPRYSGMAKVLQAYAFATLVDSFGDIPFTDALTYVNVKPRYDNSEEVYLGVLALLDEAITDLNTAPTATALLPSADDLIYGGNIGNWVRFANSLKLRLLVKWYPTDVAFANAEITDLLATPGITFISSNAQNAQVVFETSQNRQNPIDQFETRRQNQFFPTTTIVNLMNGKSDPRVPFYFRVDGSGTYTGAVPGSIFTSPTTSRVHTFLRGATLPSNDPIIGYAGDAPIRLLTFAEHNFNLAEYYLRSNDLVNAQAAFTAAITASMDMAGVASGARNTYLTAQGTLSGTFATALQQIIEEKYVANYGVAVQPWTDWRRTGFPVLTPVAGAALSAIPRILPYSDLERVTNPENTPARASADLLESNVFFDPGN
jgi:hypothetical protein